MTDLISLTVRSLQDAKGGVVVRSATFLLINLNTVNADGQADGIVTADFQGSELPTPDDLKHDLLVMGNWNDHPKHGRQFSVSAWAVTDAVAAPPIVRHKKAKKLSADEIKRLMNKGE